MTKTKTPQLVDHVSDGSDEEIDEDLAFNSDDERMYGSLFKPKGPKKRNYDHVDSRDSDDDSIVNDGDSDDDEDDYGSDEGIASDDEDGDGGQFMLDLLNNLDNKGKDTNEEKKEMRAALAHTSMIPESEFSSTAVKSSNLTLDQLMGGITDTKGFQSVKNAMRDMTSTIYENDTSSSLSTTKIPVAKVVSERAERKVHYAEQSENVSGWTQIVKTNREAETLDFRPKDRIRINKADLVQKFEPTTDFEKEIAAALEEAGDLDEKDIIAREKAEMFGNEEDDFDDDDLGGNKLSAEDYKKRFGELSKMRALMFYEEQKRHRISKIKSKKYRKIRKKQKLRGIEEEENEAAEHDEELAREIEEKAEMERMKERMSLKHRNTSKWAKRVLKRGGAIDLETRKALSEQIRKGDELKKKMEGQFGESDEEEEEVDLISQARNILSETEQNGEDNNNKGIFKLAFMKKGIEAQRKRAKEEALELIRELEGNESGQESDVNEEQDDKAREITTKKKAASAKEMKNILGEGRLVASSLTFGNSTSVQVNGDIDVGSKNINTSLTQRDAVHTETISLTKTQHINQEPESKSATSIVTVSNTTKALVEESNPWLISEKNNEDAKDSNVSNKKRRKSKPSVSRQGIVNVADAINIISEKDTEPAKSIRIDKKSSIEVASDTKIANLNQEELVKKAFATPNEKEIEEEFENEKVCFIISFLLDGYQIMNLNILTLNILFLNRKLCEQEMIIQKRRKNPSL